MKLICFPHYTCGGLLCDIFNGTFSPVAGNGGIASIAHKLGNIGDADTVNTDFSIDELKSQLELLDYSGWVGTHCWPGKLPLSEFESLICVTTTTWPSKLYRWLRAYHHYFSIQWLHLSGIELVDKMRETAKNYHVAFEPVTAHNVVNIEFADIVENTAEFRYIVREHNATRHMERSKVLNNFLYDSDLWQNNLVKTFYQAEMELSLQRYYKYE